MSVGVFGSSLQKLAAGNHQKTQTLFSILVNVCYYVI